MTKTIKGLSVAQLRVLNTAAQRPDYMVMPLPGTVRARGASQQRLLESLLRLTFVEEVPTLIALLSWRHDERDQLYALQLTPAGLAAVGRAQESSLPGTPAVEPAEGPSAPSTVLKAEGPAATAPVAMGPGGKLGQVLAAVGADSGATVEELVSLTGWQKHTTRAALTRLRQRGYPLALCVSAWKKGSDSLSVQDG